MNACISRNIANKFLSIRTIQVDSMASNTTTYNRIHSFVKRLHKDAIGKVRVREKVKDVLGDRGHARCIHDLATPVCIPFLSFHDGLLDEDL